MSERTPREGTSVFTNPASRSSAEADAYVRAVLELLGDADPLAILGRTEQVLLDTVSALTDEELARPELPGKWSVRAVLRHLADSEIVWAYRLRLVLAEERPVLTGFDQDAWASGLDYASADARHSLVDFGALRRSNLGLLAQAGPDALERVGVHSERGEESVALMIRLYAGHDLVHRRQIERIRAAVSGA